MISRRVRLAVALVVVLALALIPSGVLTSAQRPPSLSQHARELLAAARADLATTATLLVAVEPGSTRDVAAALAALGGTVRYEDDAVGYVRVVVPIDTVEAASRIDGIEAVDFDELIPLPDPRPEATEDVLAVPPPGPGTPSENPYMPTQDIGAPQFVAAHPTFDGRGVTIGIVDTGIDLFAPELQTAKRLDGTPVAKFADWVTFTDPVTDRDPTWIDMKDQIQVAGPTFIYGGASYTAPAPGLYRIGIFSEAALGSASEYGPSYGSKCSGADVNRNGICNEAFAVLWRTADNMVWVDANADRSLADEPAMTDYRVRQDVGRFGVDDPGTAVRESVPFVVQTDGKDKFVNIGIVAGAHATHVAGIAAGKGFFGGAFNGAAPEARIVSVRACMFSGGCTAHAMTEGMIYIAKQANVDVINMSIGGLPALNDGNNARAILYDRLIHQTKAQMFISAGNSGAGSNTVGDPSVATDVMSVGAYASKQSWLSNYGASAVKDDGLFVFSSRGPREDGGFKPDIVAPGSAVSCIPAWQPGQPVSGTYTLPPGYGMFNGTSMAAPQSTGGAALLISAAQQTDAQYRPEQLRQAIRSSARYLPAYGAYEQGNGLFQVGAAWELLRTNIKVDEISSTAPVNTVLGAQLLTPWQGPGIHEREGWVAGQTATRTITFERTSGGSRPVAYQLEWVGNDGTFASASTIALPLDTPVSLAVTVHPASPGAHSALLNLRAPGEAVLAYQVMNTIVAAEAPTAANGWAASFDGTADRADKSSFFFNVPAGTAQLAFEVTNISGSVRMYAFTPMGLPFGYIGYVSSGTISGPIANPTPGVWEIAVDTSRTSSVARASFTVRCVVLGASIDPPAWTIEGATAGTPSSQTFTFTNTRGGFTGYASGGALGSAQQLRPTIDVATASQWYDLTAPAAGSTMSAQIGNPSDPMADLDLYLYDCTTGTCVLRSASARDATSEEKVSATASRAGLWRVRVIVWRIPAGSTEYDYTDVVSHSMFGSVALADTPSWRAAGTSWSKAVTVTPLVVPPAGRFLLGYVRVRTTSSIDLASAPIVVKF